MNIINFNDSITGNDDRRYYCFRVKFEKIIKENIDFEDIICICFYLSPIVNKNGYSELIRKFYHIGYYKSLELFIEVKEEHNPEWLLVIPVDNLSKEEINIIIQDIKTRHSIESVKSV